MHTCVCVYVTANAEGCIYCVYGGQGSILDGEEEEEGEKGRRGEGEKGRRGEGEKGRNERHMEERLHIITSYHLYLLLFPQLKGYITFFPPLFSVD